MPAAARRATQAAYALQLALGALSGTVERCSGAALPDLDIGAVLACAQQSSSALVRAAALALLGKLASALPQAELERIVQVGCAFPPHFCLWGVTCKAVSVAGAAAVLHAGHGDMLVTTHCSADISFLCKCLKGPWPDLIP